MGFANTLAEASRDEIEAPKGSGILWRVCKVDSELLARAGVATLHMVAAAAQGEAGADDAEAFLRRAARVSEKDVERIERHTGAVVCAAVEAVKPPGEEWESISVVLERKEEDLDAGKLHISKMPAGSVAAIYEAVEKLHKDSEGAAERLARFREGA